MDLTGAPAGMERWRLVAGTALLVVLAAVTGHAWGQREAEVTVRHGFALAMEGGISVSTHDDGSGDFSIPRDVPWRDSAGSFHEHGRPECLPPVGIGSIEVTYATVRVPSEYGGDKTVWVDCSGWDESTLTQRQRQNLADYRRNGPAPFIDPID
jgi:hypothetical protein